MQVGGGEYSLAISHIGTQRPIVFKLPHQMAKPLQLDQNMHVGR